MKDPCVICCGLILMTEVVGESVLAVPATPSDKTFPRISTIRMV